MSTLSISPSFTAAPATADTTVRPVRSGSTVRLTRRGRAVVFLTALVVALGAAFILAGGAVGTEEAGTPPATEVVQVAPGDTLWGIASEIAADGDVRGVMSEIEELNALDSVALTAGQMIRIPVTTH